MPAVLVILRSAFQRLPGPPPGPGRSSVRSPAWLSGFLLLAACVYGLGPSLAEFARLAPARLFFWPGHLEWMEGLMLDGAWRLWHGGELYGAPGFDYVPAIYPPGFSVLLGAALPFAPEYHYPVARLLSLSCLVLTMVLLYMIFARRLDRPTAFFMGFMPLTYYALSGYWLDVIRVDNLYLMLLWGCGAAQLCLRRDSAKLIAAALLFLAAFFTKQSSLVLLPAIILYWLYRFRPWFALLQLSAIGAGSGLLILYMQSVSDGRFWSYFWETGNSHGYFFHSLRLALYSVYLQQQEFVPYLVPLLRLTSIALIFAASMGLVRLMWFWRRKDGEQAPRLLSNLQVVDLYLFTFACGLVTMTFLLSAHVGSFWNNNLPALYGYSVLGLLAARNLAYVAYRVARRSGITARALLWLPFVALIWIARGNYQSPIRILLPNPAVSHEMVAEQARLLGLAREYGPAFFAEQPLAPSLGWRAPPHYHLMSLEDLRSGPYLTELASLATPENLKPFRFLFSAKDELSYPGFERYDLTRVGLRPDLLRFPTGADRHARYIHVRPAEAPAMLSRLRAAVSQYRTGGAQPVPR